MVKFEGKIGTLYQIFTPCTHRKFCMMFKRKGGGVKGLLNNVKKNCTFLKGWLPLVIHQKGMLLHLEVTSFVWSTSDKFYTLGLSSLGQ